MSNRFAVLMCVYSGDTEDTFIEAFNSIKIDQVGIDVDLINVYLHIDGVLPKSFLTLIESLPIYKVVHSSVNVGLASGLNKLLAGLGDEDFVFRMDSDDIACPNRIHLQSTFLNNDPTIDFSGGSMIEFIGDVSNQTAKRVYPLAKPDIDLFMRKASPFSHVTVCFRASSLSRIGKYPENDPLNEDIALWNKAAENGCNYANQEAVLCLVRMDDAYSRRSFKKSKYELKVYLRISKRLGVFPFYPLLRFLFRLFPSQLVRFIYNSSLRTIILK